MTSPARVTATMSGCSPTSARAVFTSSTIAVLYRSRRQCRSQPLRRLDDVDGVRRAAGQGGHEVVDVDVAAQNQVARPRSASSGRRSPEPASTSCTAAASAAEPSAAATAVW